MSDPQPPYPPGPYPPGPYQPAQYPPAQYPQGRPPQSPPPQSPPASQQSSRRPLLLAGLAGFVSAAVIALVLSFAGALPGGDDDSNGTSSNGTSSASISLPTKVDAFVRYADVTITKRADAKKSVANIAEVDTKTAQALSAAHSGAGADAQTYGSQDLMVRFQAWAVRGPTPPPVLQYQDAAFLGLGQPQQVVRKVGSSWCSLFSPQSYPAGTTPPANSYSASYCQRSDEHLTVVIVAGGGNAFNSNPTRVANAVDEIWDAVS